MIQAIKSKSDESRISKQMEINWNLELQQVSNNAASNKHSVKQAL